MNKNYKKLLKKILLCSLALAQVLVAGNLYAEPSESFKERMALFQNREKQAEQEKASVPLRSAGKPSAAAIFREKQAIAALEKALQSMDLGTVKKLIDVNQALINSQEVEPLRVTVLKVCYKENDRNKQLEILDYLLSVDGINVNLASNKPITQNALDVAVKNINGLKSENLKAHYKIIAQKLIAKGAQLNELAQSDYAREIVAQLGEVKPVAVVAQESIVPIEVSPIVIPEVSARVSSPAAGVTQGRPLGRYEVIDQESQGSMQAGARRISGIAESGLPLRPVDESSSLGMRTQVGKGMPGVVGVAGRAELNQAQAGTAGRYSDSALSVQAESEQKAADALVQSAQKNDEFLAQKKLAEISEGDITLADRQRAEKSMQIAKDTEQLAQADDELRALRNKLGDEQDELNKVNEKIAKKERKINALHQEREQLTDQLLAK